MSIVTGFLITGLTLLGIGLDRLLNVFLLSDNLADVLAASMFTRLVIGETCTAIGSVLLAFAGYLHFRSR